MHKKHHKLMAEAFARIRRRDEEGWWGNAESNNGLIDEIEDEICLVLNQDNPAFSYEKFTNASGRKD